MSSDQAEEYEVEYVQRAKVVRKRGRKAWSFEVKWKGYGLADNTWEPLEHFEGGSEHFITRFWDRIDLGGRDPDDLSQFNLGEEVFPTGPPRRKGKKFKIKHSDKPDARADDNGDPEHIAEHNRTSVEVPSPPSRKPRRQLKRERDPLAETEELVLAEQIATRKRSPRKHEAHSTLDTVDAVSMSPRSAKRQKRTHRSPSDSVAEMQDQISETSAATVQLQPRLNIFTQLGTEDVEVPGSASSGGAVDTMLDQGIASPTSDCDSLFGSEKGPGQDETVHAATENQRNQTSAPMQGHAENTNGASGPRKIPAHRARAANPRVKLIDDPYTNGGLDNVIEKAKSRRGTSTVIANDAQTSPSASSSLCTPAKKVAPKKAGGYSKRDASLMLFKGGNLITLPRTSGAVERDNRGVTQETPFSDLNSSNDLTDLVILDTTDIVDPITESALAPELPSGQELLAMAGFNHEEAEALPDFDEDAPGEDDPDHHPHISTEDGTGLSKEPEPPAEIVPSTSVSFGNNGAAWKWSNIFGPLGVGHDAPVVSSREAEATTSSGPSQPSFNLVLDSAVAIPVTLKDIFPPHSSLRNMSKETSGPSGKFYKEQHAFAMLDALKVQDSYARIGLDTCANDEQKRHFTRFLSRLQANELFMLLNGQDLLAMFSSENTSFSDKLELPASLRGLADNIAVAHVVIENFSVYVETSALADDARWEA